MSNILRQLALDSIDDYSNLFSSNHVSLKTPDHMYIADNV